jgi:uncharacterized membrane protein YdjX (TVP38/TMEM64 family)
MIDAEYLLEYFGNNLAMLALVIIVAAFLFFPTNILSMTTGFLVHPVAAILISLSGLTTAATIAFYLGRYLFRDLLVKILGQGKLASLIQENDQKKLIKALLTLRAIPFFPYGVVNYGFSLTKIKAQNFFVGTIFGLLPKTAFNVLFGGSLVGILTGGSLSIIPFFLFALISWFLIYKFLLKS